MQASRPRPPQFSGTPFGVRLEPVWRECPPLARLAMPLVLAMLGGIAINTTDMLMLGRVGPEALAAVSLALSLFHPLMLLGVGIGLAVTPLVTEALSAYRSRQVRRSVRQGIWAAIPFTLLSVPPLWFSGTVFVWIGQNEDLALAAQSYTRGVLPGLFFILLVNVLRSYMTAVERTRAVLVVTLLAVPLNAILNYFLIFGAGFIPPLGVWGAAIGSTLTNTAMGAGLAWHCVRARPFRRHAIFARFWRPDWTTFIAVHRLGIPIGVMIVLEVAVFGASAQIMGLIGVLELAAHQITIQLAAITFMVPLGIGQAATARVGLAAGRGDMQRATAAGWAAMALATIFMGGAALAFWLIPESLVRPFLDDSGGAEAVLSLAVTYLAFAAGFQIVDGIQVTAAHALRGLQDTRIPMWIAAFGYWGVTMPVAIWLGLHSSLEGRGVWLGLAGGLATCAVMLTWRFYRLTSKAAARVHAGRP
ncbi:MAG: MATE family efflux transporter [Geminicoccaceae bacterium]